MPFRFREIMVGEQTVPVTPLVVEQGTGQALRGGRALAVQRKQSSHMQEQRSTKMFPCQFRDHIWGGDVQSLSKSMQCLSVGVLAILNFVMQWGQVIRTGVRLPLKDPPRWIELSPEPPGPFGRFEPVVAGHDSIRLLSMNHYRKRKKLWNVRKRKKLEAENFFCVRG